MPDEPPSLDSLFCSAIANASAEGRAEFLARACGGDAALKRQLKILVAAHFQAGSFLERPAAALGATVAYTPDAAGESSSRAMAGAGIGPCGLLQTIGDGELTIFLAIHAAQGLALYAQHRFEDARETFDRALALFADSLQNGQLSGETAEPLLGIIGGRAMALFRLGKDREALQDVNLVLVMGGDSLAFGLFRAGILARSGEHEIGVQVVQQLLTERREQETPGLFYDAACVFSLALEGLKKASSLSEREREFYGRGYAEQAVGLLRWAVEVECKNTRTIAESGRKRDRDLDALRQRKEFKEFLLELMQ